MEKRSEYKGNSMTDRDDFLLIYISVKFLSLINSAGTSVILVKLAAMVFSGSMIQILKTLISESDRHLPIFGGLFCAEYA